MAVLKRRYKDINDTMRAIKTQIIDGMQFAVTKTPEFKTPEELWNWLKPQLTYEDDPQGTELLQCIQTLLTNKNHHGKKGRGDCDCFSIACCTLMIANDWDNINVVLAGRTKKNPVHIYMEIQFKGKWYTLDFTNKRFNTERPYPLTQRIPVQWKKWKF
jgi:hypothetical protein